MTRALTPYLGAKRSRGTLLQILGQIAQHDVFIETHLGTGAIISAKPRAVRDIGIEIDEETVATFKDDYADHVEVLVEDCEAFLKSFNYKSWGRVFIFVDPPYLSSTRTSKARYRYEYTERDHIRLLALLMSLPDNVKVMISGYPSALYDDTLGDWRTHEFQAMTRGGVRTEKLWMNYPPPAPFWHTQAGNNAEDRRRIKRLAARWRQNFDKRPPMEQMAILAALSSTQNGDFNAQDQD